MNMVRSMLCGKNLPKELWGEAMSTATYLLNRCPTKKLEKLTPEEDWSGFKPNFNHLRVFGSIAYRHVPDQLRKKLDDKGEKLIFVGYHSTGGYKLFDGKNRKIVITRDVTFDEVKNTENIAVTDYPNSSNRLLTENAAVTDYPTGSNRLHREKQQQQFLKSMIRRLPTPLYQHLQ